jgi:phage terminase large subunit-like protein
MLLEKSIQYANDVLDGKEIANRYVKRQCEWFLRDLERQHDDDCEFYLDLEELERIEGILKLLNFATGIGVTNKTVYEGLVGFQAFFFCNVFGFRFKANPERFKHRDVVLFICRKNGKTWIVAILFIILLLTEDPYSEFYSICKDRELAGLVKTMIAQVLSASPLIAKYFTIPKTLNGKVLCKLTNSFYQPRTADPTANNGLRPSAFIADEIGAFKDVENINAMQSGQLSIKNPLRFKITTAYPESQSIMLEELAYIKKVFDGHIKDDRLFALLYYAEDEHAWDEIGLHQANPLKIEENFNEIRDNRAKAVEKPKERAEYLCKHMNIFQATDSGEEFVNIDVLRQCKIPEFDWRGRSVWLGLDLSLTTDNTSFAMVTEEDLKIYADTFAFVPTERIEEKNRMEKINYYDYIKQGKCFACGDMVIDYGFVEDMILEVEAKYDVTVMGVGYDRYNALSSCQRLEREGGLKTVEVKQHSSVLHPATKLTREKILSKEFFYVPNDLFEINVQNARVIENNNRDIYVNKKRSNGKVDMLAALINAIYLLQQDVIFNSDQDWAVQII